MPKQSKKSSRKKGGMPALLITLLLSAPGTLQGVSEKGNLVINLLFNVTIVNGSNNAVINNQSSVR
ncbi:hypothetical protein [Atlantibacter sp.]|uniref:hypothetical protein n=1 Tax=Atlantibacter sp. TaxID=1903473 RepID=UPI00289B4345|nr:hypothetical protein [Atlantibacter sp.]